MTKKILTIIFATSLIFFISKTIVKAQSFHLSITPPLLEAMIMPGKSITKVYKLTNNGPDTQIYATIASFKPKDHLGNIDIKLDSKSLTADQELLSWFSFQNSDINLPGGFQLKSGEAQELVLQIKVPENAKEQDFYLSLLFQSKPGIGLIGDSGAQATGVIASNILLTVSKDGKPPKNGRISEFKNLGGFNFLNLPFKIYDSFDIIPFSLIVENTGKNLFKPYGSVKILTSFGKQTEFLEVLPQNILAFSQRKLSQKGTEEDPLQPLLWQPKNLAIGFYQAQASLVIEDTSNKLEAQIKFFLFPWKLTLGLGLALFFTLFITKRLNKSN